MALSVALLSDRSLPVSYLTVLAADARAARKAEAAAGEGKGVAALQHGDDSWRVGSGSHGGGRSSRSCGRCRRRCSCPGRFGCSVGLGSARLHWTLLTTGAILSTKRSNRIGCRTAEALLTSRQYRAGFHVLSHCETASGARAHGSYQCERWLGSDQSRLRRLGSDRLHPCATVSGPQPQLTHS